MLFTFIERQYCVAAPIAAVSLIPLSYVARPAGVIWKALFAGQNRACAVSAVGALYCWGDNKENAIGVSGVDVVTTPTAVPLP